MEEKDVLQELQAIRRFVRQTWVMMIVLLVVGCSLLGVVLVEFLPHRMAWAAAVRCDDQPA
jgi:uncharacterized membrane protein